MKQGPASVALRHECLAVHERLVPVAVRRDGLSVDAVHEQLASVALRREGHTLSTPYMKDLFSTVKAAWLTLYTNESSNERIIGHCRK